MVALFIIIVFFILYLLAGLKVID
ncbi:MAG: hypothetical protein ACD_12C00869G0001, partial [uncultured bacterium]